MLLVIPDFVQEEIDYFIKKCNFTKREEQLLLLRKDYTLEQCADMMGYSLSTINRINKRMVIKIIKVL